MVVPSVSNGQAGHFASLLYTIAGLQSSIHQLILSPVQSNADEDFFSLARIMSLKGRADEWLERWKDETSRLGQGQTPPSTEPGMPGNGELSNQYGVILHTKAMSLLRVLAERLGLVEESGLGLTGAETLIAAYSSLYTAALSTSTDLCEGFGYPIGFNHYYDLFGAGLDLMDPDLLAGTTASQRGVLLERCYALLASVETCIGNPDWILSASLRALVQNSAWSEHSRM